VRRWVGWTVGAGFVAAAWGVAVITPSEGALESPFPVAVELGERGVGRDIAVTVNDIQRAETVRTEEWSADGNWVVVELDAEAVVSEFANSLSLATLTVDGRTFGASERPESLLRSELSVGVPRAGSLAFELAPDVAGGDATLTLGTNSDQRLDSLIVLDFALDDVAVDSEVELAASDWSKR